MSTAGNLKLPLGSVVAIVTPMNEDGSIHWEDFEALIEWHIASGTNGIVVAGTTGECATFSIEEQSELFKRAVKIINKRVPMIAGTGANCTAEAIELTQAAADAGADATLSVVPYYNKPSQEGMYRHFMAQAEAVNIPQILYNVPGRTGCDLQNETVLRLATHKNIVGLKDATGDLERAFHLVYDLKEQNLEDFILYSGEDMSSLAFIKLGGHGTISVTANVKPAEIGRTGCDLQNETVLRLATHKNIVGLKDATGDLERAFHLVYDLKEQNLEDFILYSGEDMSSLAFIKLGGHGTISVTANVKPAEMSKMCALALEGQFDEANAIDKPLRFWHKNLFIESSPAPAKYALAQMKKIATAELRLPLVRISDGNAKVIDQGLNS